MRARVLVLGGVKSEQAGNKCGEPRLGPRQQGEAGDGGDHERLDRVLARPR
jgi:hypothetical protein